MCVCRVSENVKRSAQYGSQLLTSPARTRGMSLSWSASDFYTITMVKHWFELGNLNPGNAEKCLNCQSSRGFFFPCKDRMMGPRPLINYNLVSLAFQHVRAVSYLKVYDFFPQLLASRDLSARFLQMLYNSVSHHFLSLSCPMVLRFHCGSVRRLLWGTMAHRPLETCSHCGMWAVHFTAPFPQGSCYASVLCFRELNKAQFRSCWDLPCSGVNARSDILKIWPGSLAQRRKLGALFGEKNIFQQICLQIILLLGGIYLGRREFGDTSCWQGLWSRSTDQLLSNNPIFWRRMCLC